MYLSSIIDDFNQEVISYNISKLSKLEQINHMLNIAFTENPNLDDLIFLSTPILSTTTKEQRNKPKYV